MLEAAAYPDAADTAPSDSVLTAYDEEHASRICALLDADAEGCLTGAKVARVVLHLDPQHESDRARGRAFESHLTRAKWMTGARLRHHATVVAHPLKATAHSSRSRLLIKE